MSSKKKFVPVMLTPFNLKAQVDMEVVSRLVDFYLAAGVSGLFANCLSSEMYSISEDERLALTRHIVKYVDGRVPVVATGSFGLTLEDKADFTKRIYNTGVNAVILITGHFANADDGDDVLVRNFNRMFELTDNIPLGLYECPAPYKRVLSAEVFRTVLESNRIIYHKDTSIDQEKVKAKLEIAKEVNSRRFEFYDAHTPNTVTSLRAGAMGMSSIAGNFYPEILVWMCDHATDPSYKEEVEALQSELTAADAIIHAAYPMSAKYFLRKRGLPVRTISRTHPLELTTEQKKALDQVHERFLGWCERLGICPVTPDAAFSLSVSHPDPAI